MEISLIIICIGFTLLTVYLFTKTSKLSFYTWPLLITVTSTIIVILISYNTLFQDFEVLNGEIVSKSRNHGTYEQPYDCMCIESCSGSGNTRSCSTICQTCYETRYTVEWLANSTVGSITFDELDRSSRSVYDTPNPASYDNCNKGDPASLEHTYTNYVKGSPDSVFNSESVKNAQFPIPEYPRVYSFYKFNRVINASSYKVDIEKLNSKLNNMLKPLGRTKQVNVIVILTGIPDPMYKFAVENAWIGGKKNDVVVFMSLDSDGKVQWSDNMTFAANYGNEFFQVKLRDRVAEIKQYDEDRIVTAIQSSIVESYDRPEMSKFEYVKDSISLSTLSVLIALLLAVVSGGASAYVYRNPQKF